MLWEHGDLGSNPSYPTNRGDKYMIDQLTQQLSTPLPFNGFMLLMIGVALYFAYNKGHLQKLFSFFKKKVETSSNDVGARAAAYQLLYNHVKAVGTKTQLNSLEGVSGLILKEQETNGN